MVNRRREQDEALVSTNVYEARFSFQNTTSVKLNTFQLFDGQTQVWTPTSAVYSDLTNGQLPDGRPGTIRGAYVRSCGNKQGAATQLGDVTDQVQVLENAYIRLFVADVQVFRLPCAALPGPGKVTVEGFDHETRGTNKTVRHAAVCGDGIPFEPYPVNANERIRVEFFGQMPIMNASQGFAVGLVVTDIRKMKKVVA